MGKPKRKNDQEAAGTAGGDNKKKKTSAPAATPPSLDLHPLEYLVAPQELPHFLANHWEKAPAVLKGTPERAALFRRLFSRDLLKAEAARRAKAEGSGAVPLQFGLDVNAAKYEDGERTTPNEDVADNETMWRLFKEGSTLQVHQPQRFVDELWRLVSALEGQLACLVGANAYLTPAGTQGLAPHHDDVEIFVCQTEGSKRWRLYAPPGGFTLPAHTSGDLPDADLGEPVLEAILEEGDVLYMPRGTVHQAEAQSAGDSTHLTLSTYQRWTYGQLAAHAIGQATNARSLAGALPEAMRRGVPIGFLHHAGFQASQRPAAASDTVRSNATKDLAAGLRALADAVERDPALLDAAADFMSQDFMLSRAPVWPGLLPEPNQEHEQPTLDSRLRTVPGGHFRMFPVRPDEQQDESDEDESDEDDEEAEEDEGDEDAKGPKIKIMTSICNPRETHMMPGMFQRLGGADGCGVEGCEEDHGQHMHAHGGDESDEDDAPDLVALAADAAEAREAAEAKGKKKKGAKDADEPAGNESDSGEEGSDEDSDSDESEENEGFDGPGLPGMTLPARMAPAAAAVLAAESDSSAVRVGDLPAESEADRLLLATQMWVADFAFVVPEPAASGGAAKKKQRKK